jgi:hypothetical protein
MRVHMTKRPDGTGVLRCVRADGSVTWQKQRQGHFFAHHDLTHFAVESTLGFTHGFYGLIAQGWDIDDTTGKGARGPLPDEAVEVEFLVGALDAERAGETLWTPEEFNNYLTLKASGAGRHAPRALTPENLMRVRSRRAAWFAEWAALLSGETMVLDFPQP